MSIEMWMARLRTPAECYKQHRSSLRAEEKDDMKAILEGRDQHIRKSAMLFAALDPETSNPVITLKHLSECNG